MSKIWTQSLKGSVVDLVDIDPKAIDFREMCEQLANCSRYYGGSQQPVSGAFHTLIALDCCEEDAKPWVALHVFHELRGGHILPQTKLAMMETAGDLGGQYREAIRWTFAEFQRRHEVVIHAAAGLSMPTTFQRQQIRVADLRAVATERRDFLGESQRPWAGDVDRAKPSIRVYRANTFGKCAFDVGQELHRRLGVLLPALNVKPTKVALKTAV